MNILDIQNRLRQLNAQKYLSDEEHEEKEQLLEELALRRKGVREQPKEQPKMLPVVHKPQDSKKEPQEKTKREHTVVGKGMIKVVNGIFNLFKEKPVTEEEVVELQKRVIKYRLKADIEKSKATIRKARENRFGSISETKRSTGKTRSNSADDISDILRGSVKGSTKSTFYSNRSERDYKKAFYG